jgi:hypothetical protein
MSESINLTTPEGIAAFMSAATSERDWNSRCDQIKAANGGYPSFWFATIILSGLAAKIAANWGWR